MQSWIQAIPHGTIVQKGKLVGSELIDTQRGGGRGHVTAILVYLAKFKPDSGL